MRASMFVCLSVSVFHDWCRPHLHQCAGTMALGTSLLCFVAAFPHVSGNHVGLYSLSIHLEAEVSVGWL